MTITSIGYGDIATNPHDASEQLVASVLIVLGGLVWANVLGTIVGIVSTLNPDKAAFRNHMDKLNNYMTLYDLPAEMRRRLREYFHESRHLSMTVEHIRIISTLSPALQMEVVWYTNRNWMHNIWFLSGAEKVRTWNGRVTVV